MKRKSALYLLILIFQVSCRTAEDTSELHMRIDPLLQGKDTALSEKKVALQHQRHFNR